MKAKNLLKKVIPALLLVLMMLFVSACAYKGIQYYPDNYTGERENTQESGDDFTPYNENDFINADDKPISYFSMDVSTASYSVVRNYINKGMEIDKDMVKLEEMVNYFRYDYPAPQEDPLSITGNMFPCPWNSNNILCSVGIKAQDIQFENIRNNLVFLIDTSGSMYSDDKLGLLQQSFCILADNLNENDVVSIVTYAGNSRVMLSGESGENRMKIKHIINELTAGGGTAGASGITTAYSLAEKNYIEGGNNRVILATDGDFNIGISSQDQLKRFVSEKRIQSKGVYLSIMGFGLGNLKNTTMDTLAQNGNGAAYYIDSILEAKKVMAEEMKGTLVTVADDVKAAVTFNPDKVESYRLLGYETKLLTENEWNDDTADAGEIGAGHTVTAVYEIVPKTADNIADNVADNNAAETENASGLGENYFKASVRYKEPYSGDRPTSDTREVHEIFCALGEDDILTRAALGQNEDLMFITCVIEFGLILRGSVYRADASINDVIARLENLSSVTENEYRADFLSLVKRFNY